MSLYLTKNKEGVKFYSLPGLKEVQKKLLELLIVIDNVARKNNIEYWIDGGTLLGAVRHKGFIPWDDDIDICLMKDEYDKFLPILNDYTKKNNDLSLMYYNQQYEHWDDFLLSKKGAVIIKGIKIPVKVDIFPMKLLTPDPKELERDKYLTDIANYFVNGKTKHYINLKKKFKFKSLNDALFKKTKFLKHFNNIHVKRNMSTKSRNDMLVYRSFGDSYDNFNRGYNKYSDIFPLEEIEFEGYKFKCPKDTGKYLKEIYNNYNELPALRSRKPYSHKIDTDHTFSDTELEHFVKTEYSYFYYSNKPGYKLQVLFRHLKHHGIQKAFSDIIHPFIVKLFRKQ